MTSAGQIYRCFTQAALADMQNPATNLVTLGIAECSSAPLQECTASADRCSSYPPGPEDNLPSISDHSLFRVNPANDSLARCNNDSVQFWSRFDAKQMMFFQMASDSFVSSFRSTADAFIGSDAASHHAKMLNGSLDSMNVDHAASVADFSALVFGSDTIDHFQTFMSSFERWLFGALGATVRDAAIEAIKGLRRTDSAGVEEVAASISKIRLEIKKALETFKPIQAMATSLKTFIGNGLMPAADASNWEESIWQVRAFCHDYGDVLAKLDQFAGLLTKLDVGSNRQDAEAMLEEMHTIGDFSNIAKLVNSVINLESYAAKDRNITLEVDVRSARVVPEALIHRVYRALREAVENAVKYRKPDKQQGSITVQVYDVYAGRLVFRVWDDGVGIKNPKNVRKLDVRERPDLAKGTGTGLANLDKFAKEMGGRLVIRSKKGSWTEVRIEIDASRWQKHHDNMSAG